MSYPIIKVHRLWLPVYENAEALIAWSPEHEANGVVAAVVDLPDRVETLLVGRALRRPDGHVRLRDIDVRSMHDERPVDASPHFSFSPSTMAALLEISEVWPWLMGSYEIDGMDEILDGITGKRAVFIGSTDTGAADTGAA